MIARLVLGGREYTAPVTRTVCPYTGAPSLQIDGAGAWGRVTVEALNRVAAPRGTDRLAIDAGQDWYLDRVAELLASLDRDA